MYCIHVRLEDFGLHASVVAGSALCNWAMSRSANQVQKISEGFPDSKSDDYRVPESRPSQVAWNLHPHKTNPQKLTMGEILPNFEIVTFEALQAKAGWKPNVSEAVAQIESLSTSGTLFNLVQKHGGALLIRGLPISDAESYSQIAHAFRFLAHEEVGRPPVRTILAKNVKTANEGPPELPIWPHNEYGWSTHNPAWLTFSCLDVPESGGATPIISSIGLAHRLEKEALDFFQQLLQKGVRYLYGYRREQVESTTCASVFAAYGQHVQDGDDDDMIRAKIEKEVKRHSELFEWHEDSSLSVTHIVLTHLELALYIAEEMQVDVQWQRGDLVLLDNYAVMHSRRAWIGKRTVLAALWDGKEGEEARIGDFEEGKKILDGRNHISDNTNT
ncbi:Clavaminate synthase-like protein [Setomelanomma holmii]|uniref:Clavaminate synthase-like protein n=1 Tax=Setomelanomma holmii TaxID=210430 RepID=A0A9P4LQG0_9PLEO|nr:Clavaminate synthase-like protein [Setomelanomma holmii]